MLGGLLVGGLIGSLLFGGMGGGLGGLGGGIGLMEIVLIGGLIVFAIMWMRRRQAAGAAGTPAYAGGYGGSSPGGWQPSGGSAYSGGGSSAPPVAVLEAPAETSDLDRGVGHIRQMDAQFDPAAFGESATDMFFKIQAAWTNRDMSRVTDLLTPEMRGVLQAQCDKLRADRRINRLENIAVRQAAAHRGLAGEGPGLRDGVLPGEPGRLHDRRERRAGAGRQPDRAGEVRGVLDVRPAGWAESLEAERDPASGLNF